MERQLTKKEVSEFLNLGKVYKMQHHNFNRKASGKVYCSKCGLMALNNKATDWAIDKGCFYDWHPSYKR